ncbi:hypothetical protein [Vibrio scophthalmi]|uniref:Glycosidase n=1 Tax=Vibrio scophthalmi LMG 19158 TaxID=870967 RepID=F9RR19_9VIBR|nr:hypothetical protein [Vibrio scophthalmi]EGU33605.1 hypothetical protein VIS19158_09897 [Vibrio scophthalmi LMG 19158]
MKINKIGKIDFSPIADWQINGIITPTPFLLDKDTIRVFVGFRDADGVSRIGFIDVDSKNPQHIKNISKTPVLDIGEGGCFDDNGMILGDIKVIDGQVFMFYVGFQMVKKAKFLAFSGLAISKDGGNSFERFRKTPILDRAYNASTIKAIHSVNKVENKLLAYYAVGDGWEKIGDNYYPQYETYCAEFNLDAMTFSDERICVSTKGCEYRLGKPTVYESEDGYVMLYTRGRTDDLDYYEPGLAYSTDGFEWNRNDEDFPELKSAHGWDSVNTAYPKIIDNGSGKQLMFYSGNFMGAGGVGVAEVIEGKVITKQDIIL